MEIFNRGKRCKHIFRKVYCLITSVCGEEFEQSEIELHKDTKEGLDDTKYLEGNKWKEQLL